MLASPVSLSVAEFAALELMVRSSGVLDSRVESRSERDPVFDLVIPGRGVFRAPERKGLCFCTEEDPLMLDNGEMFEFTPTWNVTEDGETALKAAKQADEEASRAFLSRRPSPKIKGRR